MPTSSGVLTPVLWCSVWTQGYKTVVLCVALLCWSPSENVRSHGPDGATRNSAHFVCFVLIFHVFAVSLQSRGSCFVYCLDPVIRATFSLQAQNSIQASLSPQYWLIWVPIDNFTEASSRLGGAHYKDLLIHLVGVNSLDTQAQRSGVRLHFAHSAACMGY